MSQERDPVLESLFDDAEATLIDESFTSNVVDSVDKSRRRMILTRVAVLVMIVLLEVVLESPLQNSLGIVADVLGTPIMNVQTDWANFVFGPINSIAGMVGMVLLGVHALIRRVIL